MSRSKILTAAQLRVREKMYPPGTRVELVDMDDPYNRILHEGSKGTVTRVDPLGDLEVDWDEGSSLKLIYGVDHFRVIKND